MKAHALANLDAAINSLHKSIANFPVGAISIHDYKPTEEKIKDIRESLVALNAKMLALRAKAEARECPMKKKKKKQFPSSSLAASSHLNVSIERPSEALNAIDDELHMELQERIAHCTINKLAIASCLQTSEIQEILENSEDNEITK